MCIRDSHWVGGVLSTVDKFFESFEEAIAHANNSEAHTVKIYDDSGELQHIFTPTVADTYA